MEQIQEYACSLYYFQNNKLIEFNLLSKRKYIHYQKKYDEDVTYNVLNSNLIVYVINGECYFNKKFIFESYLGRILIMQTHNVFNKYIIHDPKKSGSYKLELYDQNANLIKKIPNREFWNLNSCFYRQLDISKNGKIITWSYKLNGTYNSVISVLSLNQNLEINVMKINCDVLIFDIKFVNSSSRLVIINNQSHVININTNARMKINHKYSRYFDTKRNIMLRIRDRTIKIYNTEQLTFIEKIHHNHEFVYHHQKLDILITKSCYFFVITADYKLKNVNIGMNYGIDCCMFQDMIMEIIIYPDLLFELLPYEILFTDLYQMLILFGIHQLSII